MRNRKLKYATNSETTKAEATERAKRAKALMHNPSQWKIETWENLGWYYKLRYIGGHLAIYPGFVDGEFYCSLSAEPDGSGTPSVWYDQKGGYKDPNEAVVGAVKSLDKYASRTMAIYKQVKKAIADVE